MPDRQVTRTRKDSDGDILAICKPDEAWAPRLKKDAIYDIKMLLHSYYVVSSIGKRVKIHVVKDPKKDEYLRTDPDTTPYNNLDDLPDC